MPLHIILLLRLFRMWHVVKFLEVSSLLLSHGWDLHQLDSCPSAISLFVYQSRCRIR